MTENEYYDWMSDPKNAEEVTAGLDIAYWHLGYEAVYKELESAGKHKAVEAMKYTLEHNISTNKFACLSLKHRNH